MLPTEKNRADLNIQQIMLIGGRTNLSSVSKGGGNGEERTEQIMDQAEQGNEG